MKTDFYTKTDKWINKIQYVHTMDHYLALKRNDILIHAATSIDLEDITLIGRSQSQRKIFYNSIYIEFS